MHIICIIRRCCDQLRYHSSLGLCNGTHANRTWFVDWTAKARYVAMATTNDSSIMNNQASISTFFCFAGSCRWRLNWCARRASAWSLAPMHQLQLRKRPEAVLRRRHLPLATELVRSARQHLVSRLDGYAENEPELFEAVVEILDQQVRSFFRSINKYVALQLTCQQRGLVRHARSKHFRSMPAIGNVGFPGHHLKQLFEHSNLSIAGGTPFDSHGPVGARVVYDTGKPRLTASTGCTAMGDVRDASDASV